MIPRTALHLFTLIAAGLLALAIVAVVLTDPGEQTPRILFLHIPAAIATFLACGVVFVAGIGQLLQNRPLWDRLAESAGLAAVAACTVLLLTGMIWGKEAWGEWWTWSPRLTFSLVLWVLYAGFVGLRPFLPRASRARVSCVYGIIAFLDVPMVYMSVKILPDVHPASIPMDGSMKRTLLLCIAAGVLAAGWGILVRLAGPARPSPAPRGATLPGPRTPPTVVH